MRAWFVVLVMLLECAALNAWAQQRETYKWEMPIDQVTRFASMHYKANTIAASFDRGYLAPIVIKLKNPAGDEQPRVTGLEVLGEGKVLVKQGDEVLFEDDIHGAMFRFHPDDYEAFVSMEEPRVQPDAGMQALLLNLCYSSFRRFWHSGMDALLPDPMVGAAYVYSRQKGGVMLWQSDRELGGYCMETKEELLKR